MKTILWDFDGVILDSMSIREKGFQMVLGHYPATEVEALMDYHRQNGGLSRYHKFRYFFQVIRGEEVGEGKINELAMRFSTLMLAELKNPGLLIDDSVRFIKRHYQEYNMHIVSGSDQAELRQLCSALDLSGYFKSIHGSPTPKKQLVLDLLQANDYLPNECILIGDSINDYEAAVCGNVKFAGYNNTSLSHLGSYIVSFDLFDSNLVFN
jgi:phosphoglycolate phosphatase-like HAD superfamily hydrolase